MRETLVLVVGHPGREETTFLTIAALENNGGGHKLPERAKWLYWNGATPPPSTPPTWGVEWGRRDEGDFPHRAARARADYWRALRWAGDCDLVVLEDDVLPCRNALAYMYAWQSPHVTTFCNLMQKKYRPPVGPWRIASSGWWGSQALKFPAPVLARFQAPGLEESKSTHLGQDMILCKLMQRWSEPLYVHPSLVQHVGEHSIIAPGSKLVGVRSPAPDFPGVDFDAFQFQLQIGNAAPEQ